MTTPTGPNTTTNWLYNQYLAPGQAPMRRRAETEVTLKTYSLAGMIPAAFGLRLIARSPLATLIGAPIALLSGVFSHECYQVSRNLRQWSPVRDSVSVYGSALPTGTLDVDRIAADHLSQRTLFLQPFLRGTGRSSQEEG